MVQGRGSLSLPLETAESLRIPGDLIGEELQGDETVQLYVLSLVDHAHAAATEFFDDAVVRDGLADHGIEKC
jgi:hypothetical protein